MTIATLIAVAGDQVMGRVERDRSGALAFVYDDAWRAAASSHPLSVSMPLAKARHENDVVEPFLQGLLPDNREILTAWGRRFGVSPSSPFALLGEVGEDCAGAVQFVREERIDALLRGGRDSGGVEPLDESAIGARLADLRRDASLWRAPRDTGQFSLAGAQPKTALHFDGTRFGVPFGSTPTTHILKPPLPEFAGHAENEHLCLALAHELGLRTARTSVRTFAGELAIVVERFDRATVAGRLRRVHQEDFAQALAVHPASKYQSDGGPGPRAIVDTLRAHSSASTDDALHFVHALLFNWLIGGTDAHAKNFALLHFTGSRVRLAPLYDVASILPYPQYDPRRSKLAMKIGAHYRLHDITENDWRRLATDLALDEAAIVEHARTLRFAARPAIALVTTRALASGLSPDPVHALERALLTRLDDLDRRTV